MSLRSIGHPGTLDGFPQPQVLDVRVTSSVPANGAAISDHDRDDPLFPDKVLENNVKE